jgi:hypothetical protein
MKDPPPGLLPLIAVATDLRAAGYTWEAVAVAVHRSAETVRRWPREYHDAWCRFFRDAATRLDDDAAAEGLVAVRGMLRSKDEKIRRDAALALVRLRAEVRRLNALLSPPPPPPPPDPIARELEELTDAEALDLAEALLPVARQALAQADSGGVPPARPD